jgi:hypothetical protein
MPGRATLKLREIARQLLACEESPGSPALRVCSRLNRPIGDIAGVEGFRSLLSRALVLAGEQVSWLKGVHVRRDGSLEGIGELETKVDAVAGAEGEVVLVAKFLGLVMNLIGVALTVRVLQEAFPELNDLEI